MQIVPYPHPALAYRSVELKQIDSTLRKTVREMFDLMYEAQGIGLAANQVGLPFRFFIVNLEARPEEKDEELVFLNPIVSKRRGNEVGEEGCLSVPGLYSDVKRYTDLVIEAFDLKGQAFQMELSDLYARVVQHEGDHLDGIMFIDRIREERVEADVDLALPLFTNSFRQAQKDGLIPSDEEIIKDLDKMAQAGAVPEEFLKRPPSAFVTPFWKKP